MIMMIMMMIMIMPGCPATHRGCRGSHGGGRALTGDCSSQLSYHPVVAGVLLKLSALRLVTLYDDSIMIMIMT